MKAQVIDTPVMKTVRSDEYNYTFDKNTGMFARWGKTEDDDPEYSPFGNEILDIEVTTICNGVPNKDGVEAPCKFCYKSNNKYGKNMSFETFKKIFDNQPKTLTQIAFGADAKAESNPELFKMMEYCREHGVIPNITVANISDTTAKRLSELCGAVAVSRYENKDVCYNTVKKLTDLGMKQVNIHVMNSFQTYDMVMETFRDSKTDPRLQGLNAIVVLSLKQCGRGTSYSCTSQDRFTELVKFALDNNIKFGFDSCSCRKFLEAVKDHPNYAMLEKMAEPCESSLFSAYISVDGIFSACSFAPGKSFDLDAINNPFTQLWNHPEVVKFRNNLIASKAKNTLNCRECPIYNI